jgi:hypothetical protein
MAQERVIPLFLDGDVQSHTGSDDFTWNGKTSRVLINPSGALSVTVGDAVEPGTMICFATIGGSVGSEILVKVEFSTAPLGSGDIDVAQLNIAGEAVTVMWTGYSWIYLGGLTDVTIAPS